jgi:hypothetical protein
MPENIDKAIGIVGEKSLHHQSILLAARTGQFDEIELRRLRRINFFVEGAAGRVVVNTRTISLSTGTLLLCILCLLSGVWIGWVIFGSMGDPQGIAISFILGALVGKTVGVILDRSFRFDEIKTKVAASAPWPIK